MYYFGEKYGLKLCSGAGTVLFDGRSFYAPNLPDDKLKPVLAAWYITKAREYLAERVPYYVRLTGFRPKSVKINSAGARWGSCSAENRLNFSWKLILMPQKSIDYVVLHELSHIREHNHSAAFWQTVAQFMPDYKIRQADMKTVYAEANIWFWNKN